MLPILIHLINRLRHKPVPWAAMEFLLASHRKNRNRIRLKQLFLLLARIACLILILMTIGQIGCRNDGMSRFLGGKVTHHYILVDDSLSMGDTTQGRTALQRAGEAIGVIASRIAGRDNQRVTILRFSQAAGTREVEAGDEAQMPSVDTRTDLNSAVVDRDIERVAAELASGLQATWLAVRPDNAIELTRELIQSRADENPVVYVLSDFRSDDWDSSDELEQIFAELESTDVAVELVRCAETVNANLAITSLKPDGSVRVAGVPLMYEVQIANLGSETAHKVQVNVQSATYPHRTTDLGTIDSITPAVNELSTILIDRIAGGETAVRRFPVFFPSPGQHAVRACLQTDALPGDNASWVVTQFEASEKVLVIDGPSSNDGRFISLALSPGGMTGLQVELAAKSALRDLDAGQLEQYETIFLLDVDRLEQTAIENLKNYVQEGGGLVFFAGPDTNLKHYSSELSVRQGGVFPIPLEKTIAVTEQVDQQNADIVPVRHPVFASVMDVDHSPLDLVQVRRVCQPPLDWDPRGDNDVEVLATVRGDIRLPLVVEKRIGKGTVIAALTSAGPQWNNWMRNPTFPTTLLLIQDYVSRGRDLTVRQTTGLTKSFYLRNTEWRPEINFVSPVNAITGLGFDRTGWKSTASRTSESDESLIEIGVAGETAQPGIYEAWKQSVASELHLDRFALNVDNRESRLELATRKTLLSVAPTARVVAWHNPGPNPGNNRGTSLVRILLFLLLTGLMIEQVLAWSASYHPRNRPARQSGAGRRLRSGRSPNSTAA